METIVQQTGHVRFEVVDAVAVIELDLRESAGRLNKASGHQLAGIWQQVRDDNAIASVLLKSAGPDFCLGSDVDGGWLPADFNSHKPIVAAVGGRVIDEGLTLLGQADVIVATPDAGFGFSDDQASLPYQEISWLQSWIPWGELSRLSLLGGLVEIDAHRAYQLGWVFEVVAIGTERDRALELARHIAQQPQAAMQATREIIQKTRSHYVRDAAVLGHTIAKRVKPSRR